MEEKRDGMPGASCGGSRRQESLYLPLEGSGSFQRSIGKESSKQKKPTAARKLDARQPDQAPGRISGLWWDVRSLIFGKRWKLRGRL